MVNPAIVLLIAVLGVQAADQPALSAEKIGEQARLPEPDTDLSRLRYTNRFTTVYRFIIDKVRDGKIVQSPPTPPAFEIGPARSKSIYPQPAVWKEVLEVGDSIDQYVIKKIEPSVVTLFDNQTKSDFLAPVGKVVQRTSVVCEMTTDSNPAAKFRVLLGHQFNFPKGSKTNYEILSIDSKEILIKQLSSGDRFRIPRTDL